LVKRRINNISILAILYIGFYLLILILDGILFPLFAFATDPRLVDIIYGNISGKIIMGSLYCIPMLAFLFINRQRFVAFVTKPIDFNDLLKSSRRALQVALEDSERRYRLLVDTSPYAITIYQHGKLVFVNHAACELLGVNDYRDLIGRDFLSIVPEERRAENRNALKRILGNDGSSQTLEEEILRGDGSKVPVELSAVRISYMGHVAIQIIAKDISERKKAEAAAQEATHLQSELEKERELSELKIKFTSMIVHDFRNPVASIALSADLIQRQAQELNNEKLQERASRISSTAKQLNGQIDDLLELGRAESALANFSPKAQDIIAFCREIFSSYGQKHDTSKHEFVFSSELEKQAFNFDNRLMEHVLDNLLANAVKYSPKGGTIQMKLGKRGDYLEIVVSDNGIGIPQGDLERIFDFFHRAANTTTIQGTGIGLTIVKQVIEKHGGTISCQSEIDKGTSFTILLPIG
jgi:PAS domain S-box-containing protein